MLFDTHTHLNANQFADDLEETITRAREAGVSKMIVVGFDRPTIEKTMELIDRYEMIYGCIGWHPVEAVDCREEDLVWIEELARHPKIVAIGETGLDYHWDKSPADVQKEIFRKQIHLAKKLKLPLVIHNRDALEDTIAILKEERAAGGIMHCFSGNVEAARECIDMNFYISLAGPITFKNATLPKEVAKAIPLERLLIETDCPYLAPHPYRGKRNEPAYVKLVAEKIAELKEIPYEVVAKTTYENALRVFSLT